MESAFAQPDSSNLPGALDELATKLSFHLTHEERDALPMIGEALSIKEWKQVGKEIRSGSSLSDVAVFVPWLTEGRSATDLQTILSILPGPARLIYSTVWKPRYDKVSHW